MEKVGVELVAENGKAAIATMREGSDALAKFGQAAQGAQAQTSSFGEVAIGALRQVGATAVMALGSAVTYLGQLGQSAVMAAANMESTQQAFISLLGSQELANKHLADLRKFADTTNFEFLDLTNASRKLQAFGFSADKIIPMLTDIGDAVAAMGGGAFEIDRVTYAIGQMRAKGKVSAEEMMQLSEIGVNGWQYLADAVGKSIPEVQKMTQKGLLPASEAIDMILAGMRQDFGGMMKKQSETALGRISTLKDVLAGISLDIGNMLLPAFKIAIEGMFNLASSVRRILLDTPMVRTFVENLAQFGGNAILGAIEVVNRLASVVGDFFSRMQGGQAPMEAAINTIASLFPPAMRDQVRAVLDQVKEFITYIQDAPSMLEAIDFQFLTNMWMPVQGGLENIRASVEEKLPQIRGAIELALGGIKAAWDAVWPSLEASARSILEQLSGNTSASLNSIADFWRQHGDTILATITLAMQLIGAAIAGSLAFILGVIDATLMLLSGNWEGAWAALVAATETFIGAILAVLGTNLAKVRADWQAALDLLLIIAKQTWENLKAAFVQGVAWVAEAMNTGLRNAIMAAEAIIGNIDTIGAAMVQGIIDGIMGAATALKDALVGVAMDALKAAKLALGIESPSKVASKEIGKPIAEGTALGMETAPNALANSARIMAGQAIAPAATATQITRNVAYNSSTSNNFTINASYPMQSQRSVADDIRVMQLLSGA